MSYKIIGKDFIPPDIRAKVTGKAKYAEDFRLEGMVFCRLLTSPVPHAKISNINYSEALAMEGVLGVLTADEVPEQNNVVEPILTNEPLYVGDPILAVAATSEAIAQDAIDSIQINYDVLPFTLDPLESLYPGGPDARSDGNIITSPAFAFTYTPSPISNSGNAKYRLLLLCCKGSMNTKELLLSVRYHIPDRSDFGCVC